MAKLVELKEAAEQLGVTPEALTELVDQKKIFGYRDGASWKFKPTEIDRVASELGLGATDAATDAVAGAAESLGLGGGGSDDDMIDVDELQLDDDSDDADSILISEEELGRSDDSTSSTIIGKAGLDDIASSDSDINIANDEVVAMPTDGGSDLSLATDGDSDLSLAGDSDLSLADSDMDIKTESAGASNVLAGDSDLLSLDEDAGNGGVVSAGSGIDLSLDDDATDGTAGSSLSGSDAVSLDDDDIKLDIDSGMESGIGADSSIDLDLNDDDDLLAGSGMGSDITLGASDSGINLSNPADSGISLEDVGSGIDSSLELGDDDMIELEADPADPEEATELQADEDFMLTPVAGDGDLDEESDDSGSQVIALDSDEFDESAATMLVPDDDPLGAGDGDLTELDEVGGALAAGGVAAAGASAVATAGEEADFSVWNIVGLSMLSVFMAVCVSKMYF
jgi:excisionase family DNA binding protein